MENYNLTQEDIEAVNDLLRLRRAGGYGSIMMDSVNFEAGIIADEGFAPLAYGSGRTLAAAIREAIGEPFKK